jgi:prophage antirepressor-like protein
MSGIDLFNFGALGVRVLDRNGEPWFVLADVCRVLEIKNSREVAGRLESYEKATIDTLDIAEGINGGSFDDFKTVDGSGPVTFAPQVQRITLVNESGIYSLIFRSRKPGARALKKWVTTVVLPGIRRRGWDGLDPAALDYGEPKKTLRERFTEECARLGYDTPQGFAKATGVNPQRMRLIMQLETLPRSPDMFHLLIGCGFDVSYLIWAERAAYFRAPAMMKAWAALPAERRAKILGKTED